MGGCYDIGQYVAGEVVQMKWLLSLLLVTFFSLVNAATVTADFEEYAVGQIGDTGAPTAISSQGYLFSSETNFYIQNGIGVPTNSLAFCPCSTLTVAKQDDNPFALESFDLGLWGPPDPDSDITITGYYVAGGSIETTIDIVSQANTYLFGAEWEGLEYFVLQYDVNDVPKNVDNVVVSGVPIPAAVWLFGSALAGLGWMRRKSIWNGGDSIHDRISPPTVSKNGF
jgi:hypothetical protein